MDIIDYYIDSYIGVMLVVNIRSTTNFTYQNNAYVTINIIINNVHPDQRRFVKYTNFYKETL
jgi:hypothetical protein